MKTLRIALFSVVSLSLLIGQLPFPAKVGAAWRDPVRAPKAMVASQHPIASQIGLEIMKKGGNAVDAAIAVGLMLAVVYPEAGNLGGGGFMMIRKADGTTTSIDYRERAPSAATRDLYVDKDGNIIRGEGSSTVGYRASGVPGTPAGFEMALEKYGSGKISWAELVAPAREVAENGFVLTNRLANLFKSYERDLSKYEDSKRIFLNDGDYFKEGDVLKQPDLARTLGRIEKHGAREFYTGETARLIAEDMARNNGLITMKDLADYKPVERQPLRGNYRGHEIITMAPPSSGGIVMLQILNMLEDRDIKSMGYNSAAYYHLLVESMRRAYADRARYMGDPDYATIPVKQLTDREYSKSRGATILPDKATKSSELQAGEVFIKEGTETTHYTVVDPQGNVVSNTYTINDLYGSAVTIKGTGVLMNNEMDDFASRPGVPNLFGLVQGEVNAVGPGKRPLSSMTPTIVLDKDGNFWFATGARGGPRIISAVLQIVLNMIDHGMNIQQAIDAPRVHHQWLPDEIRSEPFGLSPDTVKILEAYGHKINVQGYNAQATGIAVEPKTGVRLGAIDSRGDGEAIGY
jgi:gamma-glutamyltranspeptidase/glutathione hydrolase